MHQKTTGQWSARILTAAALGAIGLLAFPQPRAIAARAAEPYIEAGEDLFNPAEIHAHLFQLMWMVHHWMGIVPPNLALTDAQGASFRLSDYHGKIVVLNFWATGCGSCKDEIPWLVEFRRTHSERQFAVIGISLDQDRWKAVRPVVESMKINYRVALGDDPATSAYGGGDALPQTYVLNENGLTIAKHLGAMTKEQFDREIVHRAESRRAQLDGFSPEGH
jgi:peroxiredoxin